MRFAGWQKTSLIEYPGKISTVVFVGGCNLRCPYCYNPALAVARTGAGGIEEDEVLAHLGRNSKLYQALVATGGEPCLVGELEAFLRRVKALGLLAGLETNGTRPQVLARLLEQGLVDYVALDVKGPPDAERYGRATGLATRGAEVLEAVGRSLGLLASAGIDWEARTTVVPALHGREDLLAIGAWLREAVSAASGRPLRWYLQSFTGGRTLDPALANARPYPPEALAEAAAAAGAQLRESPAAARSPS